MIASHEAAYRHRACGSIGQHTYQVFGYSRAITVAMLHVNIASAAWERRIHRMMAPEVAISVAFSRALPAGNKLHGRINKEGVGQRFQLQRSRFPGMGVVGLHAVNPEPRQDADRVPMAILEVF